MPDQSNTDSTTAPTQALSNPSCSRCGEPHDNWPDDGNGLLCQMCWESHCSEEWWKQVVAIDELIHSAEQSVVMPKRSVGRD